MASTGGKPLSFNPKADATLLSSERNPPPPRPEVVGPIYDPEQVDDPIQSWSQDLESCFYPPKTDPYAPSSVPDKPCPSPRYLRAHLAKNERLRLSMLWYYTRGIINEPELLAGLQEKACLAQESTGWEYAVVGILDINVYIRLATVGLQLAILPRGETLCAHTVTQPPGNVFLLPNMMEDWRFKESPYVEQGGLTAYAGVPLRMQHESGECVGLGSLCVASATSRDPLTKPQQQTLARLADWIVADIVLCARAKRQRERQRMAELIAKIERDDDDAVSEEPVLKIMRAAYPDATISLQSARAGHIETEGGRPILSSNLENGLWEDTHYIDEFIAGSNQHDTPSDKVVRFVAAHCESTLGPSLLVVATKDFRHIFDDVDSWFVRTCAGILSQRWQKRLLAEVMTAKETFLRGISHQLRTPIHGILGAAELLAEDLKSWGSQENDAKLNLAELVKPVAGLGKSSLYLETISTAGRDLMSTVNSMITLNRWTDIAMTDRQYAVHHIEDLETELAKGVSDMISGDTRYKPSIFFNYDLPAGRESLRVDLNLLRDSLLPIVINAIQNTRTGIVAVTASMGQDGKEFIVDVEDTGCGIHLKDQKRIFDLYEKVGDHSTRAGLGLPLAVKFATLLRGFVELVSSEVGRGSHFRATYRDVDCVSSPLSSKPLRSKLKNVPSRFHRMADGPLSAHFEKYLIRNGFTPSESTPDSLLILDLIPDLEGRRMCFSKIPPDQPAICLIPGSEEKETLEPTSNNIIYVSGPFLTSTISLALEEMDRIMTEMMTSPANPSRPSGTAPLSTNDEGSSSDEGYGSMPVSPPSNTAADGIDSDFYTISPSIDETNASSHMEPCPPTSITKALTSPAKPRALLVDDNVVNLRIMEMYCKKRGIPYCSATDGQQAIEIFSKQQSLSSAGGGDAIQLILMDLQMPVCDGIEATRRIRLLEKQANCEASVLFIVTGQDSLSDREAASSAGADEYLVKPVSIKLLDRGLKRYFPAFEAG
ncbi:hypothetical protein CDV36_004214 [Fusarium kuroshium]|uniref:histidine kinase n=1 Tax=Fusarium kuroshium TaxID=2010991 RepID=A0A3M2SEQ4_9HYPO|nr:hypothetical protein CDV36_004214 [Fusarium kuroshium]